MRAILSVLACLGLSGCGIPGGAAMWAETKQYSGDGVIHTCSNLIAGGYGIDFPKFDASRPYTASYRLSNVPPTGRNHAVIYLRFRADLDYRAARKAMASVTATIQVKFCDTNGNVIHAAKVHASDSSWTESSNLFGIYELEKSDLHFERNARYVLKVSYTPGAVPPPAKQLYFAIDNCAFK